MGLEFESLHLLALGLSVVAIILADHYGWQYVSGKLPVLNAKKVAKYHRFVWLALISMIITGALLLSTKPRILTEFAFYVKLLMVGALIINGFFIGKLSKIATVRPYNDLTTAEKRPLIISAGVSVICWLGAMTIGFLFL